MMAMADYMLCAVCFVKAYYDSGVDYGNAEVAALCGDCAKTHKIMISKRTSPPATPSPSASEAP